LYLPILFIPLFSFNSGLYARFPLQEFTLAWYAELWTRGPACSALQNSLKVGLTVSVILHRARGARGQGTGALPDAWQGPILGFMLLPLVVPGLIFGVALLVLVSRLGIPLSLWTVGLGTSSICLPFAISILLPRFEGSNRSLEEASADSGRERWWTFWRVTFPTILPGVLASLLLTFTVSFDEFIIAFFLSGTDPTLPMFIWNQLRFPQSFPSLLALSTLILVVVLRPDPCQPLACRMGRDCRASRKERHTHDLDPECQQELSAGCRRCATCRSTSRRASSSRSWARRARARPRFCGCSRGSKA
jgi:spermidine/putrescine transport system permease protein